jgi:hypothetical protein
VQAYTLGGDEPQETRYPPRPPEQNPWPAYRFPEPLPTPE